MPIFTGNLGSGLSQLGVLQLGGPPAYPSAAWTKTLPTTALPFLAHVYGPDGVTFQGSLKILNRPTIKYASTNGSYDRLLLDVPAGVPVANVYGSHFFGGGTFGGAVVGLGNVIKLTEQGGDGSVLYAGIVNSLPETVVSVGTSHQIEIVPLAFQLSDAYVQLNYTVPTDIAQMVRDAVTQTPYCHCDQTSVPASTGITAILSFGNRPAIDVLNTVRHIAGYSWFWHVGPTGRVWFQPMGSGASGVASQVYTAKMGVDYMARTANPTIESLKNDVLAIGGVTSDNVTLQKRYTGGSQSSLGVKSLNPPVYYPQVTNGPTLQAIVNGIGAVLDRVWNRITLSLLPGFGARINCEQPGGAMIRYFEPAVNPMLESSTGTGNYVGPYVVQNVTLDGAAQSVTAGDAPVTDVHDFDFLVNQTIVQVAAGVIKTPSAPIDTPH